MTDLTTEHGLREAFDAIGGWVEPVSLPPTVTLVPAVGSSPPRRRRLLGTAAALVLVVASAVIVANRPGTAAVAAAQGEWTSMAAGPLAGRRDASALWSGSEAVIWGGYDGAGMPLTDGARYDPVADRWTSMAPVPEGIGRLGPSAFVDGRAVYVLYDLDAEANPWDWDLVAYDPVADEWATLVKARFDQLPTDEIVPRSPVPTHGPEAMVAVGDRAVVVGWNSHDSTYEWVSVDIDDGTWTSQRPLVGSGGLYAREKQIAVTDGDVLVGVQEQNYDESQPWGYLIDVRRGTSAPVPALDLPNASWNAELGTSSSAFVRVGTITNGEGASRRAAHRLQSGGAWVEVEAPPDSPTVDGSEAELVSTPLGTVLLGGLDTGLGTNGGLRTRGGTAVASTPTVDQWARLPNAPVDLRREGFVALWTGHEIVVWGGATEEVPVSGSYIGPGPSVVDAGGARYVLP